MNDFENPGQHAAVERLQFLTLHLHDLQSIRWAPGWLGLGWVALRYGVPMHGCGDGIATVMVLTALVEAGWFWLVTWWTRRVYGRPTLSQREKNRVWLSTPIRMLFLLTVVWRGVHFLGVKNWAQDWCVYTTTAIFPLMKVVDATNLRERRWVYGVALAALVAMAATLSALGRNDLGFAGMGAIFILLGVYDWMLLVRVSKRNAPPLMAEVWHG